MAEVVRVSRERGDDSIIVKDGGKYHNIADSKVVSSYTSLSSATHSGSWRRPSAAEKGNLLDMAQKATSSKKSGKTFRVPPAVQQAIEESLNTGTITDPMDVHFATELASGKPVGQSAITWVKTYFARLDAQFAVYGGEAGRAWVSKFADTKVLTAAAFVPTEDFDYFAVGEDEANPDNITQLVGVDPEERLFVWVEGDWFALPDTIEEYDMPVITEISGDDAKILADWIDDPAKTEEFFVLTDIDPEERNLVELAYSEIDWEEIDRLESLTADATGYSPAERSNNASRQHRSNDGKFGGPQAPTGTTLKSLAKGRLPDGLPLVDDPAARIEEYLGGPAPIPAKEEEPESAVVAAGPGEGGKAPLYFAVVDSVDQTAVLDVLSIVPDEAGNASAWRRSSGEWVSSPESLDDLRGATPPPVVELNDDALVKNVLAQVDEHDNVSQEVEETIDESTITASAFDLDEEDSARREFYAKKGLALPDGSYPILDASNLKAAVSAFNSSSKEQRPSIQRHIRKRARALNRTDLIPSEWREASVFDDDHMTPLLNEYGQIVGMVAAGSGGNAETLRQYWTAGKGAAKIRWGTEGDLTRCHRQLSKYMPGRAWGYCQNLHQRVFGMSNAKRDKLVGD